MKRRNLTWGFYYDDRKIVHFKGFKYNGKGIYVNHKGEQFMRAGKKLIRLKDEGAGW